MKGFPMRFLVFTIVLLVGCGQAETVTTESNGVSITVDRETAEQFDLKAFRQQQADQFAAEQAALNPQ
jgi:hypothetical protein